MDNSTCDPYCTCSWTIVDFLQSRIARNLSRKHVENYVRDFLGNYETPGRAYPVVVTHSKTHQFRFSESIGAPSSCGLCASDFLRFAFTEYIDGRRESLLLRVLFERQTFMNISDIAQHYQRTNHLEVTELVGAPSYHPIPGSSFTLPPKPGLPYFTWVLSTHELEPITNRDRTYSTFYEIIERLDEIASPVAGAIITGQPEILSVLKIPVKRTMMQKLFIVYDSHGYQDLYPDGAGMVICPRREDAAAFFTERFKPPTFRTLDSHESLLSETLIDASFVVPRWLPKPAEQDELLLEASMRMLHLGLDISELEAKLAPPAPASTHRKGTELVLYEKHKVTLESLRSEIRRLTQKNMELEAKLASLQDANNRVIFTKEALDAQTEHQKQQRQSATTATATATTTTTTTTTTTARQGRRDVPTDMTASNGERTALNEKRAAHNGASTLASTGAQREADTESAYEINQAIRTAAASPPVKKTRSICAVVRRALRRLCVPSLRHRQSCAEKAHPPQSGAGSASPVE